MRRTITMPMIWCLLLALVAGPGWLPAQGNGNVRIKVEKSEDGKVTVTEDTRSAEDVQDLKDVLREYGVDAELQGLEPGEEVEIVIRRKKNDDLTQDITIDLDRDFERAGPKRALLGVFYESNGEGHAVVTKVVEGSAAEKAGLEAGDVIVSFDGEELGQLEDLAKNVREHQPGDEVRLELLREDRKLKKKVTLGEGPAPRRVEHRVFKYDFDDMEPGQWIDKDMDRVMIHKGPNRPMLGVTLRKEETIENGQRNTQSDLEIQDVMEGSAAAQMGLQKGDRLLSLDGTEVNSIEDVSAVLGKKQVGDEVTATFDRGGQVQTATAKLAPVKGRAHVNVHRFGPGENRTIIIEDGEVIEEMDVEMEEMVEQLKEQMRIVIEEDEDDGKGVREFRLVITMDEVSAQEAEALSAKSGEDFSGQSNLELASFRVGPNPSSGNFNLTFELPESGPTEVVVLEGNGNKVFQEDLGEFRGKYSRSFDIGQYAKGIYFIQIRQGDKAFTRKVVTQ